MYQRSTDNPQGPAFEFKRVMAASLEKFLEEHDEHSKKTVAAALDASSADLSHWLSMSTPYTMHAHLVPIFCALIGDNALLWHLQEQYENAGKVA